MVNKIKTKTSNRVAWIGYVISFLFISIGVLSFLVGLFFDPTGIGMGFVCIIYGLIIYVCWEAFSKIVKAAEIYIGKNKNLIE